jgi:hypothetical protein
MKLYKAGTYITNERIIKYSEIKKPKGWVHIFKNGAELVKELDKLNDHNCRVSRVSDGYYVTYTIVVTDEVGALIDLYMSVEDDYADMKLSDFVKKALSESIIGI